MSGPTAAININSSGIQCGVCDALLWDDAGFVSTAAATTTLVGYYPDGRVWVKNDFGVIHSCSMEEIPNPYLIKELPL